MSDVMQIEYNPGKALKDFLVALGAGKTFTFRDLVNTIPVGAYRSQGALSGALYRMTQKDAVQVRGKENTSHGPTNVYVVGPALVSYDPGKPKPERFENARKRNKRAKKPDFTLGAEAFADRMASTLVPEAGAKSSLAGRLLEIAAEVESLSTDLSAVATEDLLAEISRRMK